MPVLDNDQFRDLLESKQYKELRVKLTASEASQVAELLINAPAHDALLTFRLLPKDMAVDVFDQLDGVSQNKLLECFSDQAARSFLEQMPPDDRADLLDEVPAVVARKLLQTLSAEERRVTTQLLGYREGSAGREMTPLFVDLHSYMTVAQALDRVRQLAINRETIYECYVMDRRRTLLGTVSLKDLVLSERDMKVADIMQPDPLYVFTATDREEVARLFRKKALAALPVVDAEGRLVGIITHDDIADILEEETTEDIYRFGAVPGTERGYFTSRIMSVVKRRVGWLFLLILVNTVTASVIAAQQEILAEVVIMAAFIPLLIGTGGNVGAQSATVIIRGLATGEVHQKQAMRIILREAGVGAVLGVILGAAVLGWAYFLGRDMAVAIVVSSTLLAISILATTAGGALPFLFRVFRLDPALVSAPFITTIMDIFGIVLYFAIAHLLIRM